MTDIPPHLVSEHYRSRVTEKQIFERATVLTRIYLRVKANVLGIEGYDYDVINKIPGISLNDPLLLHGVKSYWYDVLRFKDFHHAAGDKRINRPKKAAYTVKWIMATKPIYFDPTIITEPMQRHLVIRINEIFAFRAALQYAGIPLKLVDYGKAPDGDLVDKFTYNLEFRGVDVGFLSLWFETFLHFHGLPLE